MSRSDSTQGGAATGTRSVESRSVESRSVESLCEQYRPLAVRLARRYSLGPVVDEDLLQVAMLGLLAAADRFDPSVGQFRPFAVATISGELKKYLRGFGWAAHVPRRVQEAAIAVDRATDQLTQTLGRSPTPDELSERTGLSVELILDAVRARQSRFSTVLSHPVRAESEADSLASHLDLRAAIERLPVDDQELLLMSYESGLTQRQIASRLEVSQTQISRRLNAVLADLRQIMNDGSGS